MKDKIKVIVAIIIIAIISLGIIKFLEKTPKNELSGSITLWTTNKNYDYMKEVSKEFMEKNRHVTVDVKDFSEKNYFKDVVEASKKNLKNKPDMVILNDYELYQLRTKEGINPNLENEVINSGKMNFSNARLQAVSENNEFYGVPFSTKPLVLYLREDILKKYKLNDSDVNTWNSIIKLGKELFRKSDGSYKLLSGNGEDYKDLVDLLIIQNMNTTDNEETIIQNVQTMIKKLEKENVLTVNKYEDYAGAIASYKGMKDIKEVTVNCQWSANNPPAAVIGGNKFFIGGGENLVSLNKEKANLTSAFMRYITNNIKASLKYTIEGQVFSSYQYTYKDVEIENKAKNFIGKSPLVVMSNITEKASNIPNYNLYLNIKDKLIYKEK